MSAGPAATKKRVAQPCWKAATRNSRCMRMRLAVKPKIKLCLTPWPAARWVQPAVPKPFATPTAMPMAMPWAAAFSGTRATWACRPTPTAAVMGRWLKTMCASTCKTIAMRWKAKFDSPWLFSRRSNSNLAIPTTSTPSSMKVWLELCLPKQAKTCGSAANTSDFKRCWAHWKASGAGKVKTVVFQLLGMKLSCRRPKPGNRPFTWWRSCSNLGGL